MNANEYKELIDNELTKYFRNKNMSYDGLLESMDYSLTAGGKRIRGTLVLEFCRMCGGDYMKALPVACAIEMLHAYSLIHDDLPCMDNDDLRRGKPTNHKVYGECTAVLAGDALQAEAFGTILRAELSAQVRADCAEILADAAGVDGICGGQYLDMTSEGKVLSEQELDELNSRKTGALIIAACQMGVISGGGNNNQLQAAAQIGAALGAAFQIRDDMLDVISTAEELGKPIGSDAENNKNTFMARYGAEKCADMIDKLTKYAKFITMQSFTDNKFLLEFADSLVTRLN